MASTEIVKSPPTGLDRKPQVPAGGEWHEEFLAVLARVGVVRVALARVGVSYSSLKRHREADPEFAEAYRLARAEACANVLEPVAWDRATMSDKSDGLLRWMMAKMAPDEWGDAPSKVEITGKGGAPIEVAPALRIRKPGGDDNE